MILDTDALSAWIDGDKLLESVLSKARELNLNSISLGEFRFGILSSRYRIEYENRLALIESDVDTLSVDQSTAGFYALIRAELKAKGRAIPYHDIWIAALARQHRMPILSRDTHFDDIDGLVRVGWKLEARS